MHAILVERLAREGRAEIAQACYQFLPTRALLEIAGWAERDIFSHERARRHKLRLVRHPMTRQSDTLRGRRQRFAAPWGFHGRMVRMIAVSTPAMISALPAVLVIAPFSSRGEISFPLDRNKVAMVTDHLRVVSAICRG